MNVKSWEPWRLTLEFVRDFRPLIADLHHFDEEPDQYQSERSDPDPHQSKKPDLDPHSS
jgi:hypothetical protein